jgi:hypothetical protein
MRKAKWWIGFGAVVLAAVIGVGSSVWPEKIRPHPYIVIAFGIFGLLCIIVPILHTVYRRIVSTAEVEGPAFEIIFDATNTGRQFWSLKSAGPSSSGLEYRVKIRNITTKTLREVKAETDNMGPMGHPPIRREKHSGNSQPTSGAAWSSARVFCSSKAR